MSEKTVFVYVDFENKPLLVGRLFARARNGRESATFEYDASWLKNPSRFALEPALSLHESPFHTRSGVAIFGSIGDSSPDRFGRMLMRRAERMLVKNEGRQPRSLKEVDFLLAVDDESRQGALRFSEHLNGPFLADSSSSSRIPLLVSLPKLLSSSDKIAQDDESDEDTRLLLAPGSSLGGARPKASVRDLEGNLWIAKFPHPEDEINLPAWESVALTLAEQAGIKVARHRLDDISGRSVILLARFDREKNRRIPFLSAMSLLGALDHESHSYLEIVDALRRYSASPAQDLTELWKRIVFSILISNTDDHLRNHGLLLPNLGGWRLSPAYDINPMPIDIKPRRLSTSIDEIDHTASLDLALCVAGKFNLTLEEAKKIARDIACVTEKWRTQAKKVGIKNQEIDRMSSAFEHADVYQASSG